MRSRIRKWRGTPVSFDRFHREEEIGKSLDHPGLLKVLPADHRSQIYMVTEWFDGKRLRHLLNEQGKLSAERAMRIALNVCDVLTYIHNHGIVHRNLKPENILVDDQDHIKLINFGVAAKTGAKRITFTNLSQVTGISEYLSPEELNGKRGDERSDIYALGVILYEMLTGKTPFHGTDASIGSLPTRFHRDNSILPSRRSCKKLSIARWSGNTKTDMPVHTILHWTLIIWIKSPSPTVPSCAIRKANDRWQLKTVIFYASIALLPIVIFGLLLWFAKR